MTSDVINYAVKWINRRLYHVSHKNQETIDLLTSIRKELWNYEFKIQKFSDSLDKTLEKMNFMENAWHLNLDKIIELLRGFWSEEWHVLAENDYKDNITITCIKNIYDYLSDQELIETKK